MKPPLDRYGSGLATLDNRFDDIGRKVSKSQKPTDIGVAEVGPSRDLHRVGIFIAATASHQMAQGRGQNPHSSRPQ